MITFEQACKLYEEKFPTQSIISALDVGDEWVFSAGDKETGEELDVSPIAISKDNGSMRTFFPPANREKLRNAVEIDLK